MNEIKLKSPSGKQIEFTSGSGAQEDKMVMIGFGVDFSGKSSFPATYTEGLVGVVPVDRKTRFSAEKRAKELGTRLLMPKKDLVREQNKVVKAGWGITDKELDQKAVDDLTKETMKAYRNHINEVKDITWALHDNPDVGLIVIDLAGQLYQDFLYAHYGRAGAAVKRINEKVFKDHSLADQEYKDFVESLTSKHLLLMHKRRDEYIANKPTGHDTWEGYKYLGHSANMVVEFNLNRNYKPDSEDDNKSWHYGLSVVKCLHNTELEGEAGRLVLRDSMITWETLMALVFPN